MDEDSDTRTDGFEDIDDPEDFEYAPRPTFEEDTEINAGLAAGTRHDYARGTQRDYGVDALEAMALAEDLKRSSATSPDLPRRLLESDPFWDAVDTTGRAMLAEADAEEGPSQLFKILTLAQPSPC